MKEQPYNPRNCKILVESFTRLNQSISGILAPADLPRLADYLASPDGELRYQIEGSRPTDEAANQKHRLKCIIKGLILLRDPTLSEPVSFEINLTSHLVLVNSEADLPPLEEEPEDEDYIVAGPEIELVALIAEEVILSLPLMPRSGSSGVSAAAEASKQSPFAKLAELKKTRL